MSEGKEIKFKFVVDEQSAQRVNRVLDEMIKRAQDLAKTLQGVGGVGGGSTGLLSKGTVGGGVSRSSPQSTMASAAGGSSQKVSFASVLGQNVDMLKKMGTEGTMAMKAMSDALATGVTKQKSSIGALEGELSKLLKMYQGVGVQGGEAFSKRIQDRIAETTAKLGAARKELTELQKAQGQADAAMAPEGEPGKLGRFARISRIPGIGGMLGGVGGLAGGAMFAAAGAAAAMGVKAASSQFNAAYNAPLIQAQQRVADTNVGTSGYARKLRAGDYSDVRAMDEINRDPTKRQEWEDIQAKEGSGFWGFVRRTGNRIGAAKDAFSERGFKEGFSEIAAGQEGVSYQRNMKQALRDKLNMTIEERGVLEDIDRDATGGAMGKMALQRALGIGNGRKKTGAYVSNSEKFLNAYSQFDAGELQTALSGIMSGGTRQAAYAKVKGGGSLFSSTLQAQAAGIGSAGQLGGVFSRQGAGRGMEMVDLLRSVAGGGTDVSTANLIGSYMAQQADRLNISQFGGQGAMGALSFGTKGPEGAMVARQNIQGMGRLQELYAGSRDPAQAAMNFALARKTAPDVGYYGQNYLATKLDSNRIADALGPGKFQLTEEEKNLGLTPEMIRKQARAIQNSQKFRVMEKGFAAGSDPAKMLHALKGGENLQQYALKNFAGDDGKWSDDERKKAMGVYSTLLRAGNQGLSASEAEGQARLEMFGLGRRTRKGKMAGDVAGGSFEAKVAKQEAEVRETDRQLKDADMDRLEAENSRIGKQYRRLVTNSESLAITADNITEIISTFAKNLKAAAGGGATSPNTRVAPKE